MMWKNMRMGGVIKVYTIFDSPFWKKVNLSGSVIDTNREYLTTFDQSPTDCSLGILVSIIGGNYAIELSKLNQFERRNKILTNLVYYFGQNAKNVRQYYEVNWITERMSQGGSVVHIPPNILTSFREDVSKPIGRIFFAGSETSSSMIGYCDGALISGERVSIEVLNSL